MESILNGIPNVVVYLDVILVRGSTEEKHLAVLKEVLKILQMSGLHLKKEKLASLVVYLGHRIDSQGIHPFPEKVRNIQEAPQLHNITELHVQ